MYLELLEVDPLCVALTLHDSHALLLSLLRLGIVIGLDLRDDGGRCCCACGEDAKSLPTK